MPASADAVLASARERCESALDSVRRPAARSAMITVTADRSRREAEDSDSRRGRQRLRSVVDGMPVVWKDVFDVAGSVTTCGSALLRGNPIATADSALVGRLRDLGMVTIGKTNLSEFAFSGLGINQSFGTPVNPLDAERVPGGSSSGAAVAVAAGIASIAVGTDTSGSVRVPAAFTGCVGYRASRQRYGRNDFRPLSPTLDSVGLLARTIDEIRLVDRVLVHQPDVQAVSRALVPSGEWIDSCTEGVRAAFDRAVEDLRDGGIDICTARFDSLQHAQDLLDTHGTIVGAEAYAAYRHLMADPALEPATRRRLRDNAGTDVSPVRRAMPLLRRMFRQELAGAILLCPTVSHEPPRVADLLADDAAYDATNASTLRATMVLSYLDACGVSLPVPGAGLLMSAPAGEDGVLLATAAVFDGEISAG